MVPTRSSDSTPAGRGRPPYCRALSWIEFGGTEYPILPWLAVKYLLIGLVALMIGMAIVEWRLGALAMSGQVVSTAWALENERINRMNFAKIRAAQPNDALWRTAGIPKPPVEPGDRRRILVLGDSFVWGDGHLNANETWWRQLERELRHRGYEGVDVVAAGLNGASTQDQLRWLRETSLIKETRPSLIALGYVTNDPDITDAKGQPLVKQIGRDVAYPEWGALDRTIGTVVPNITLQMKQRLNAKWASKQQGAFVYGDWEMKLLEPPNIDAYRSVVADLGETVKVLGIPLFAVTLPNWPEAGPFKQRYRPVAPIFAEAGIEFHDLVDEFVREYPPSSEVLAWGVNPANGHPGPVATRFYARQVADILERDYPAILGPRSTQPIAERPRINDWMPPTANVRRLGLNTWELVYPAAGEDAPEMPLERRHVMLAFAEPSRIDRIRIRGARLQGAELDITTVDPQIGVENRSPLRLGRRSGSDPTWELEASAESGGVNTLRISAQFAAEPASTDDRTLRVEIDFTQKPSP